MTTCNASSLLTFTIHLTIKGVGYKLFEGLTVIKPSYLVDIAGIDVVELASNEDHNVQLKVKAIGKLFQLLNAFLIG